MESNDSPEDPDRGRHQTSPASLRETQHHVEVQSKTGVKRGGDDRFDLCWYVCCLARTGCWTGRDGRTAPLLEYSHFPGLVHWVPAAIPQLQLKHVVTAETSQHVDNREHRPTAAKRARYT